MAGVSPPCPAGRLDRLVVTRPAPEATGWVSALRAAGWPAQAVPLIEIGEPADAATGAALAHWRGHWATFDALMFVSPAAVQHFFHGAVSPVVSSAVLTRFWAPGPGTAKALAQALAALGVGPGRVDAPPADAAQFDSEALWPVVQPRLRAGQRVLIVRGVSRDAAAPSAVESGPDALPGQGRDWLIRQCEAVGVQVQACVAYERRAPAWDDAARATVRAATEAGSVWLFSSSEALAHLADAQPQANWGAAHALVTHPRIAERARQLGFGRVVQTRPALSDVLSALESNWSPP